MTGLSALHTGRTGTSQFFLQLHNIPSLFSQSYHLIHNLLLFVEHEQRVIDVGDARDNIGLHHGLIVFHGQELHLRTALHRE